MNINKYIINGLQLPQKLIQLLENNQWKPPIDKSGLKAILKLPKHLENRFDEFHDYADFKTYRLELMTSESAAAKKWPTNSTIIGEGAMFLGAADDTVIPGNIETDKAILIADLGIGSDSPFTLDYRNDINNPSVMMIYWGDDATKDNRWLTIAQTFDEFLDKIGIEVTLD